MAGTKEKMQQARQLIQEKRYDEARAILRTVDHDKAYEWLDKIDAIQGKQKNVDIAEKPMTKKGASCLRTILLGIFGTIGFLVICGMFLPPSTTPPSQPPRLQPTSSNPTELLLNSLMEHADGFVVESVRVVDTRNRGGEKGFFVTYISNETTATELERELVDVFDAAGAAIEQQGQDFDSVVVIIKDPNGEEFCCFLAEMQDIASYRRHRIPRSEFFTRIQAMDY